MATFEEEYKKYSTSGQEQAINLVTYCDVINTHNKPILL